MRQCIRSTRRSVDAVAAVSAATLQPLRCAKRRVSAPTATATVEVVGAFAAANPYHICSVLAVASIATPQQFYRLFEAICGAGLFRASAEVRAGTISKSTQSRQFAIH